MKRAPVVGSHALRGLSENRMGSPDRPQNTTARPYSKKRIPHLVAPPQIFNTPDTDKASLV